VTRDEIHAESEKLAAISRRVAASLVWPVFPVWRATLCPCTSEQPCYEHGPKKCPREGCQNGTIEVNVKDGDTMIVSCPECVKP
jgi:hypothetical protein